jgi:hypothetical protein
MSKREIIIVFAALIAIMYAVYSLFIASSSKQITSDTNIKKTGVVKFIANLSEILDKNALDKTDIYIIARAEAEWEKDPFLKTELAKQSALPKQPVPVEEVPKQPVPVEEKLNLTYSGYLEMGDKKLAIINDVEYETNDELELVGYIVEKIEPLRVIISDKERQRKIIVPIKEEVF